MGCCSTVLPPTVIVCVTCCLFIFTAFQPAVDCRLQRRVFPFCYAGVELNIAVARDRQRGPTPLLEHVPAAHLDRSG